MSARVIPIVSATAPLQRSGLAGVGDFLRRHQRTILWLQWLIVAGYVVLVALPAFLPLPPERAGVLDNLTRFAQFAFWGIWWPFVILSMMAVGRAWCGFLCPEGALTEWASRHGAGLRMPKWLKWPGWPLFAFLATTIFGQMVSVYEYAKPALLILGGSTVAAVAVGALYGRGKRLWCRHLCPVSGVFAILARVAPVHFKVDRDAWSASTARATPINCAPLLHLKSMHSAAECHMCARCSGHREAITLALRAPGREVISAGTEETTPWQSRLLVWGMLGVATGAFQWSASPWLVAVKQRLATWLVDHDIVFPLANPGHWWFLTHYPEANDVFSWLDGAMVIGYIVLTAIVLGSWVSAWLVAGEKALGVQRARHALAMTLAPFAGLMIFVGLFGVTAIQLTAEGFGLWWLPAMRTLILVAAIAWSGALSVAWTMRQSAPLARRLAVIAATLTALVLPACAWVVQFYVW
jgi:hypothetical protein